ncbi:peroxidase 4-like [Syzygium oleosum]|uniref:peroxidase 4-like n=1 Tax=Syzygium oleosum TaxID=219896 RepID=UPI0011D2115E|nr:peroxidase 4-like [Syzygium oleosum]XP_056164684.1 peroxidase 4-like [Syzygium oleosum]
MAWSSSFSKAILTLACVVLLIGGTSAQLSIFYYAKTCPQLFPTVKSIVHGAIAKEARMGASLTRLFFHDCFVNGCDGSNLLDDTPTFTGEKNAAPNKNSLRGFDVVDKIKSAVEKVCPGVVSCADLLAIISRDSVETLGGPGWDVKLGRRDARTASQAAANNSIPPPTNNLNALISSFQNHGLSQKDLVALYGAHTIGQARCTNFRARIYNESNIDSSFARTTKSNCPRMTGVGDNNLAGLDFQSATSFDNNYYVNLVKKRGLLHSDQQLFNGGSTDSLVRTYAKSQGTFFKDFVASMINMGDIKPLTGSNGEIRKNCRRIN